MAYTADLCIQSQTTPTSESLSILETCESSLFPDARGSQPGAAGIFILLSGRMAVQGCFSKVQSFQTVSIRVYPQSGKPTHSIQVRMPNSASSGPGHLRKASL